MIIIPVKRKKPIWGDTQNKIKKCREIMDDKY